MNNCLDYCPVSGDSLFKKVNNKLILMQLCRKNNWFTCGSNEQFDKFFYAIDMGASLDEIITMIWICSDDVCRRDIRSEVIEAVLEGEKK